MSKMRPESGNSAHAPRSTPSVPTFIAQRSWDMLNCLNWNIGLTLLFPIEFNCVIIVFIVSKDKNDTTSFEFLTNFVTFASLYKFDTMHISIIGAGNVATSLAPALVEVGHRIDGVCSRTQASAKKLAQSLGCPCYTCAKELPQSDAYILCVPDDALPELVEETCKLHPDAIFIHIAGSAEMNIFSPYAKRYGVLYPLQTFSRDRIVSFGTFPIFYEGSDARTTAIIEQLARSLSQEAQELSSENRMRLHTSAVFACNFVNHCFTLAADEMQRAGLDFSLLKPLIRETVQKIEKLKPIDAQTGPAVRNDESTMQKHMSLIADENSRKIYRMMSESILLHKNKRFEQ